MNDSDNSQQYNGPFIDEKPTKKKRGCGCLPIICAVLITAFVTSFITMILCNIQYAGLDDNTAEFEKKLSKVNGLLDEYYLYDIDKEKLIDNAVKAYIEGLDEPYTAYYPKEEFSSFTEELEDSYVGIGVVISMSDNNQIEVVAPFEGSPAYNAGILPGDILKSVNGTEYLGEEMDKAVSVIRSGKAGTTVDLVMIRNGEELQFTIERGSISSESVTTEMLDNNVGLVRISSFNTNESGSKQDTYTEFKEKIEKLQGEGMQKMIIDLRDNPGGALDVVCNIADMIVPKGTITYMEYKDGERETFTSDENEMNIPIAVLINENSASASEVLTGALKDYKKAVVVGKKSYGKGIVQSVYPFMDGSGISMTVAKYYSPNGVCIHGTGIEPDINVDMDEKYKNYYASSVPHDEDTQLKAAIEAIK